MWKNENRVMWGQCEGSMCIGVSLKHSGNTRGASAIGGVYKYVCMADF